MRSQGLEVLAPARTAAYVARVAIGEPLSAIEASFVELEQPAMPMHVAGLVLFESTAQPVTIPDLQRLVSSRLRRVRGFHERVRTRLGEGAVWERAPRIRPQAHFMHHALRPPGDEAKLRELCGEIHEARLDRARPLWEVHLIDGLAQGRQALLIKTHHAINDGLLGMEVANMLFDPAPGTSRPHMPVMRFAQSDGAASLWTGLQGLVGLAFTAAAGPVAVQGPFNGAVSGRRAFGMASLSMRSIKVLKRKLGASVDDVLAATVASGIGLYLRDVGYPATPPALKAMLPVSTRRQVRGLPRRNDVSAVFIDLPMTTADLPTLVQRIGAAKAIMRAAHAATGSAMLVEAVGLLPAPLHAALMKLASGLPFANLVLSDIPGPDEAMQLLGRRIVAAYPMMPLSRGVGLSIATISMGGVVGVGVTADPSLVPDVQRLASAIEHAWQAGFG